MGITEKTETNHQTEMGLDFAQIPSLAMGVPSLPQPVAPTSYVWKMFTDDKEIPFSNEMSLLVEQAFQESKEQIFSCSDFFRLRVCFCDRSNHKAVYQVNEPDQEKEATLVREVFVNQMPVSLPFYWNPVQSHPCEIFPVSSGSDEFLQLEGLMKETIPNVKIHSIGRVQNLLLYQRYLAEKRHVFASHNVPDWQTGSNQLEMLLFHGSKRIDPRLIASSFEGFDPRLSSDQNLWGAGCYFSESARYASAYAFDKEEEGIHQVMIASVLVGVPFDYGPLCNSSLHQPPVLLYGETRTEEEQHVRHYDSVMGETKLSQVFSIYSSSKAYPSYIVDYHIPDSMSFTLEQSSQIVFA